jgi:hypothetical protein
LANGLRLSQGLQRIYLKDTELGDKGAIELAGAFDLTPEEKRVHSRYQSDLAVYKENVNKVVDSELVSLFKPKKPDLPRYFNQSLTHIELSNNNISDIGVNALCQALVKNASLPADASRAKMKTSVRELNLSGNKISDVTEVRKLLEANQNITINLSGNNISPKDMSKLKEDFGDRVVNKPPAAEEAYTPKVKK